MHENVGILFICKGDVSKDNYRKMEPLDELCRYFVLIKKNLKITLAIPPYPLGGSKNQKKLDLTLIFLKNTTPTNQILF